MYFVYVLKSDEDGNFYIGYSTDLKRRVVAHLAARVAATKSRLPLKLIYFEAYLNRLDAKGREMFLKSGSGHRFLKKQLKNYLKT